MSSLQQKIFKINSPAEFDKVCMDVFHYQANGCSVYKQYLQLTEIDPAKITAPEQIPALPIRFFKSRQIVAVPSGISENQVKEEIVFTSSSTTGMIPARHYVLDTKIYETSFTEGFRLFYGQPSEYTILALLPSYLERKGSSLVYMAEHLIRQSEDPLSGFYLYNHEDLYKVLLRLKSGHKKCILLGVSFALLDFVARYPVDFPELIVIETGGMKGRGKELGREELHRTLAAGFGVKEIHSEYGMAELMSQAYSVTGGVFKTTPWMRIYIRDLYNPFRYLSGFNTRGGINIIDLANINSCAFIETEDMGRIFPDGSFTIDGRIKEAELRGCNLLLEQ